MEDIFEPEELEKAKILTANHMQTSLMLSSPKGGYTVVDLPEQVQYSCVYETVVDDFNQDGNLDALLLGNNRFFKLRLGKFDANYGMLLTGDGKGNFRYVPQSLSGLQIKGDVRSTVQMDNLLLLGISGKEVKAYELNR